MENTDRAHKEKDKETQALEKVKEDDLLHENDQLKQTLSNTKVSLQGIWN